MKAARLVSEIVLLSARPGSITAADLANRLEVTVRTIYRDIAELSTMGVPVIAESGPGGGISLLGTWTSPIGGMTRDEWDSVLLGTQAANDLGMSRALAAARSKILTEVDPVFAGHVLVDGPDWFMTKDRTGELSVIAEVMRMSRGLRITYSGPRGTIRRTLVPLGLVIKAGRWYLVAARPGGRPRTYRISRITEAEPRFLRVTRSPDFHLGEYWEQSQVGFDEAIRGLTVRLRMPVANMESLRRVIPGRLTERAIEDAAITPGEPLAMIDIPMEPIEIAVSQLLQVPGVEVLAPTQLRLALLERVEELGRLNR